MYALLNKIGKLSESALVVSYVTLFSLSLVLGLEMSTLNSKSATQWYKCSVLFLLMSLSHDRLFKPKSSLHKE